MSLGTPHPWLPALAALGLPALLLWPAAALRGQALVAHPRGEVARHLWGWWAAAQEQAWLGFVSQRIQWPDGARLELIDPLHLLLYLPAQALLGPLGAWNAVCWAGLSVGGAAGWALARQAGADRDQAWVGLAAGVACPGLVGVVFTGMSEELGAGWVILQLALLLRLLRRPGLGGAVLLGLAIAAAVYAGPYNAVWIALLDLPLGLWALRRTRWPLLGGLVGGLLSLPYLLHVARREQDQPGGAGRWQSAPPTPTEAWRGAWGEGTDLLDLLLPQQWTGAAAEAPHTGYLGLSLLLLAALGAWRAGGRRGALWLGAALAFAGLALGPWTSVGGELRRLGHLDLRGPAWVLESFTPLRVLSRWYRAGAVAALLLVPLAATALQGRRAWAAALLVLVDLRLGAPFPARLPVIWPPDPELLRALPEPLAELPRDHTHLVAGVVPDQNILAQVLHGRTTNAVLTPGSGSMPPRMALERVWSYLGRPTEPTELSAALEELHHQGFRSLVLWTALCPSAGLPDLEAALGPPARGRLVLAWTLPEPAADPRVPAVSP